GQQGAFPGDLGQLLPGLTLDLGRLVDRLDDHVALGHAGVLGGGGHARDGGGSVLAAQLLALDEPLQAVLDAGSGARQRVVGGVQQDHVVPGGGAGLGDAGTHGAGTDNCNSHRSPPSVIPRPWRSTHASSVVRIISITALSSTLCSTKLGSPMLLLAASMQPVRTLRSLPSRKRAEASISTARMPRASISGTSSRDAA